MALSSPLPLPQDEELARQLQSELDQEEETPRDEIAEQIVSTCHNV